eukprot:3986422-Alexandrium_andersonii.AAC.1
MSASLVGSEMCIRDSLPSSAVRRSRMKGRGREQNSPSDRSPCDGHDDDETCTGEKATQLLATPSCLRSRDLSRPVPTAGGRAPCM